MFALEMLSFVMTFSICGISLLRIFEDIQKNKLSIIINIICGGFLFVLLNMNGFPIVLNAITAGIIALLGIPGVALISIIEIMSRLC